jgi:predicted signal transduction protein with EAL and GGDEF domain
LLRTPLDVNGKSLSATASIGIALYPDDDLTPAGLLKSADIALYRAKYEGRDRVVVFDGSMRRRAAAPLADPSQVPSDRRAEDRPLLPS